MSFSLHQGWVVMPSQITHIHTIIKIHPLAHLLDSWASIFSSLPFFYILSQPHHVTTSLPSPGDNHQITGGRSERTRCQAKMATWNSFSYICTRALHSFRSLAHCRAASVISLLPKATFTPSIQPNLGLPRTRPPLTSAINTHLAIRYSSIVSTCPNHLNTHWSALLANSLYVPALLRTSSFLTLSIRDTPRKLLVHLISRTFTFLLIPHASASYNAVGTITFSYRHFLAYIHNPLLLRTTFQRSPSSIPLIHSVYHIPFTSSISCHLRSQELISIHFLQQFTI